MSAAVAVAQSEAGRLDEPVDPHLDPLSKQLRCWTAAGWLASRGADEAVAAALLAPLRRRAGARSAKHERNFLDELGKQGSRDTVRATAHFPLPSPLPAA